MRRTIALALASVLAAACSGQVNGEAVAPAAAERSTTTTSPEDGFRTFIEARTTGGGIEEMLTYGRSACDLLDDAARVQDDSPDPTIGGEIAGLAFDMLDEQVDPDVATVILQGLIYLCPEHSETISLYLERRSDPATTTTAPPTTAPPTTAEDPEVTAARGTAGDYLDSMGFCRPSLIDQLEYEGYSNAAAVAAVDSLGVDWAAETVRVAQGYVDSMDFSHAGLVDQLDYEGCEAAHAEAAATQVLGF